MVLASGRRVRGKTYLAVAMAISRCWEKVNRIVLARRQWKRRAAGFLPGTLQDKTILTCVPLYDALTNLLDPEKVERYLGEET